MLRLWYRELARWEVVSLTWAPLLLGTMIILIRFGAGRWSVDGWLAAAVFARTGTGSHIDVRPRAGPPSAASCATWPGWRCTDALKTFSSRCARLDVPGMSTRWA
jgi:hypothetical protein